MEWNITHIDETDSTNRWLRDAEELHIRDGSFCVVADYQTAGRGCGTNSWESERGQNLTFSLLIHPEEVPANQQFHITEAVSVALCQTLEKYLPYPVSIKWPNDIYVNGRKICGILTENRLQGTCIKDSIIGIGLNVNQMEFVSDAPNPVSMRQLTGESIDREALLHAFLKRLDRVFSAETLCLEYRNRLFQRMIQCEYSDKDGHFTATIVDVEPDGHLIMRDSEGRERRYAFKEVQFVLR